MAFDFPNTPANGDRVTGPGGIVYVWDGVKWASSLANTTVQSMGDTGRNLLHNSMFRVQQRGAGPWTTAGSYTADRWQLGRGTVGGSNSVTIAALGDAGRAAIGDEAAAYYLSSTFVGDAAALGADILRQRLEDVRRTAGKTLTVSFWASSGTAGLKLGINATQAFGTGGSPSASVYVLATGAQVTLTTGWARYSVTIPMSSVAGKTFGTTAGTDYSGIEIYLSSGTTSNQLYGNIGVQSGTVAFWGVQLEIGSVATPLEKLDIQQDLAKCQRFYAIGTAQMTGYQAATSGFAQTISCPVSMRAIPAMTSNFTTQTNCTGAVITPLDNVNLRVNTVVTALGTLVAIGTYTASADL